MHDTDGVAPHRATPHDSFPDVLARAGPRTPPGLPGGEVVASIGSARTDTNAPLDERQREAVESPAGPLLVLAGAGSGKTRVLTERAAMFVRGGYAPEAVLLITFTNRAAEELRARLATLLGEARAARMTVGTFHSVCHKMLRRHARRAGRTPAFSIYDSQAGHRLIARALAELDVAADLSPRLVALQMGQARARLLRPADYRELARSERALGVACVWDRYERALEHSDALDFDELLVRGARLLEHPDLRAVYRRRWRAVLVDEYQDTNPAQDTWVRRLTGARGNLTVVADDDQAIYHWRGADVRAILEFERNHPDAQVIALERNYRSAGAIVAAAANLVSHNRRRRQKRMWTLAGAGVAVGVHGCADERDEGEQAATWCRTLMARGVLASEIAVLFRTRVQARVLEDALLLAGVPYRVVGGHGLWESASIRDLVAHLTLLVNPRDQLALSRALMATPGAGPASVARVLAAADAHDGNLVAACTAATGVAGLRGRAALAVETFGRTVSELSDELSRRGVAATCAETVIAAGLADRLKRESSERSAEQVERLRRFCATAHRYERDTDAPSLADFLAHAALSADEGEQPDPRLVTLSTLHGAKGAEWDHVRITGLCEGLLPHARALRRGELEEERRLAYVGLTRARRELTLTWPRRRYGRATAMSRFLMEAGVARVGGEGLSADPRLQRAA